MARRGKAKATSKSALAIKARYDAAGNGRRMAGWNTPSSGPNTAISGLQKIRDRARDVVRNDWSGAATVRLWTTNLVGTGIVPRPKTKDAALKAKLRALWEKFVPDADADCVLDFYGIEALVVRAWASSGEVFVRQRPRRMSDGFAVPLQIQVLEADMCPLLDADTYSGLPTGNYIRQGVEFDRIGRRVAFWFYRSHPGDKSVGNIDATMLSRVPANQVCHVFEPQRPGQIRGVSEMASIINKLKNVADFDDALLERQRLANLFLMFVTKPIPSGANDPMTGVAYEGDADAPMLGMEPGISQELMPGEDVKFSEPPDAGNSYPDFMRTQNLGVASGNGLPYELLSGDIKDVSDRTMRIVINEFHRLCEQRQWLMLIPQMCQKVRNWWADFSFIAGEISAEELEDAKSVVWAPQAWAYLHPVQDVQAKALEVESGFRSRASVISTGGYDPEEVDTERAEDNKREKSLGLKQEMVVPTEDPQEQQDPQENSDGQ